MYSTIANVLILSFPFLTLSHPLVPRDSAVPDTLNDLVNGVCKEFTLVFARGTDGAGNIGGPGQNLADALINKLGADKVAVQGVSAPAYPATWTSAESPTLQAPGAAEMAGLADQAMTKCPSTKLVLSGYSQGALVCSILIYQTI